MGLPELCNHPSFPAPTPAGSEQSWVLQLHQVHTQTPDNQYQQQVQCSVYHVNYGDTTSDQILPLQGFTLKFDGSDNTIDNYLAR